MVGIWSAWDHMARFPSSSACWVVGGVPEDSYQWAGESWGNRARCDGRTPGQARNNDGTVDRGAGLYEGAVGEAQCP